MNGIEWLLQLHADGAEGAGAEAGAETGVSAQSAEPGDAGSEVSAAEEPAAQEESFDDLIKGRYRDEYRARTEELVRKRLEGTAKEQTRLKKENKSWAKIGRLLGERYGMDPKSLDVDQLVQRVMADNSNFEDFADRDGTSPDTAREKLLSRWEREDLQAQIDERNRQEQERSFFASLSAQEPKLKEKFGEDFSMEAELGNEQFLRFLSYGMTAEQAYETIHHEELLQRAREEATQEAARKTAAAVAAGAARPRENGNGTSGATISSTPEFSRERMAEIERRAKRGERIGPGHPLWTPG